MIILSLHFVVVNETWLKQTDTLDRPTLLFEVWAEATAGQEGSGETGAAHAGHDSAVWVDGSGSTTAHDSKVCGQATAPSGKFDEFELVLQPPAAPPYATCYQDIVNDAAMVPLPPRTHIRHTALKDEGLRRQYVAMLGERGTPARVNCAWEVFVGLVFSTAAALHGQLEVLQLLVEFAPGEKLAMICTSDYGAFQKLVEWAPDNKEHMVKSNGYNAFHAAAVLGNVHVLCQIIQNISLFVMLLGMAMWNIHLSSSNWLSKEKMEMIRKRENSDALQLLLDWIPNKQTEAFIKLRYFCYHNNDNKELIC
ncbi:hypothetical protein BJ742DRAFT_739058 [Cladochytrium replicatum]|nr:hypothetical protein BJ742DRAFT_739058 [Cladochytrium replicatum]